MTYSNTMTLRVDEQTRTALSEIAQAEGVSVSALLRQQIAALFIISDVDEWV
jgi:predicted HicB family RNase H-like nuclease